MSNWDKLVGSGHGATEGLTNRFAGSKQTSATLVNLFGENMSVLVTPQEGKQVTLYWIAFNSSEDNKNEWIVSVFLNEEHYCWLLGRPGAFMHWEPIVGRVGDKLQVLFQPVGGEASGSNRVAISYTYTESYPPGE